MHGTRRQFALSTFTVALVAAVLVTPVIAVTGYMALQDFGEWNYQGYVLGRAFRGESMGVATLKDYPVPYTLGNVVIGVLSTALSPLVAGIGAIAIQVAVGAMVVAAVIRSRGLDWRTALPILGTLVILGSGFWNGYSAHQIGLAALTASLAVPRYSRTRPAVVVVFSLLTFFSHALVFLAYAIVLGVLALADRRVLRTTLAMLPSVGLTLWYAAYSPPEGAGGGVSSSSPVAWVAYKGYTFAKSGGYQNLVVNGVGDARPVMLLGSAINAALVGLILLLALPHILKLGRASWRDNPDVISGSALLALGIALPAFFLGIVNPGERLIGPGLIVLTIAALEAGGWPRLRLIAAGVATAGLLVTGFSSATLAMKSERGDAAPQDPSPTFDESSSSRTDVLFSHRLDQMESRYDVAERAWDDKAEPTVPLIFNEGLLSPSEL